MKTLFIGQNCIHLKSVDSTNSYASELLRQIRPPEGTVIYTFEQLNGRGQRGNTWESEPNKNTAFTVVLYPSFLSPGRQFLLNKIISLAVADLMAELLGASDKAKEIKIKWPNDIYAGGKKTAGILIENTLRENTIQSAIAGIGININQTEFSPAVNAVSLAMLADKEFDLMQTIDLLCEFIEARYLLLKANKIEGIDNAYLQRLYQLEEWCNYTSESQTFEGKIIGVSFLGKLQVILKSDEVREFNLKEIQFM